MYIYIGPIYIYICIYILLNTYRFITESLAYDYQDVKSLDSCASVSYICINVSNVNVYVFQLYVGLCMLLHEDVQAFHTYSYK